MSSEEKQLPKPKRRWFQLRLRTLLVLVTLAAAPLSWAGWEVDQRRREKVAIAWLEENGGGASGNFDLADRNWWERTKDTLFGTSVYHDCVMLNDTNVDDITPLANLKNIEVIYLGRTFVSDLTPLAKLPHLRHLYCGETPLSDLSPLSEIRSLRYLYLPCTPVSDLSPLAKLDKLEKLQLDETEVKDLSPLTDLKHLTSLTLRGTTINEDQIDAFQKISQCGVRTGPYGHGTYRKINGEYQKLRSRFQKINGEWKKIQEWKKAEDQMKPQSSTSLGDPKIRTTPLRPFALVP